MGQLGRPLTADMLPAPARPTLTTHPVVAKLARRLPDAIAAACAGLGSLAVHSVLEDITEDRRVPQIGDSPLFALMPGGMPLGIMTCADRTCVLALTDLAFGGTGLEPPCLIDRPLSRIEEGVRDLFHSALAAQAADAISASLGHREVVQLVTPPPAAGPDDPLAVIVLRFLVSVAGYDGELRLCLHAAQLSLHLDHQQPQDSSLTEHDMVKRIDGLDSEFSIVLPAEPIRLSDLAALRPGGFLQLTATVTSPVLVRSGSDHVFTGRLAKAGDMLAVRIDG